MKYLKSTTQKAYTVGGKTIPPCVTPRNETLALNDSEWFQVSSQPVIAALIKSGDLLVLDEDPNVREDTEVKNQLAELKVQNTQLAQEKQALERQLAAAQGASTSDEWKQKYEQLEAEALKEIASLKRQLAEVKEAEAGETETDED